jgi:catechol 2,3-dioxygenase-like lactoylglutathione lyase family enzyme
MRGLVHHLVLTVWDPAVSFAFYDTVLSFLGHRLVARRDDTGGWAMDGPQGKGHLGLVRARDAGAERRHDRYSPGFHHLAWVAESRDDVDELHRRLLAIGASVLDPPAEYPRYNRGRGYYAVFFADPDGSKLEFVLTPPP